MKVLVIYHANCFDGFCAAWLLNWKFPDAEFHAAHYGTEPPNVKGKRVIIADFSYPRETMLKLIEESASIVVLDHHKTAQADLQGIEGDRVDITFDMSKSGGRLTWEWINCGGLNGDAGEGPWQVAYTEDRDLWKWELPHSREVNAALRSYPLDFKLWDELAQRDWKELVPEGAAIRRCEVQTVEQHTRHAQRKTLAGHSIPFVNATVLFSEIAGELAKGEPFAATYFDRADGFRQWSLRSDANGVDVSAVAKIYGGGGHKNAAGYQEKL